MIIGLQALKAKELNLRDSMKKFSIWSMSVILNKFTVALYLALFTFVQEDTDISMNFTFFKMRERERASLCYQYFSMDLKFI